MQNTSDANPAKRIPISKKFNSGIALAPPDWVLREWVLCGAYGDYQCFRRKFQAKDVIENEGNTKFNVTKMEVVEEVDMSPFYEMPRGHRISHGWHSKCYR